MKNYFNNLLNSSVFRYVQHLVVLCAFLSISATVAAGGGNSEKYAKLIAYVHPKSTGKGCVYITENASTSDKACTTDEPSEKTASGSNSSSTSTYTFTFTLTAESEPGSYVAGWTKSSTSIETLEGSTSHTVKLNGTTESGTNIVSETWYAVFKPIVALPEPNKVSIKVIGGESSPTMVKLPEVVNTTQLTLSITGDSEQNEWFQLSKDDNTYASSLSFASSASELSTNGRVTDLPFYVKFVGTMENATNYAKNVVVRITAPTEAPDMYWDIPIEVTSEYDTYQFLKPRIIGVDDQNVYSGIYYAQLADADKTIIEVTNTDKDPINLTTDGHHSVTLTASPSGYKFYGWYKITFDDDGTEKSPVLVSQSSTYGPVDFNESAKIYPVYLQNEHALFRIKEDATGKLYYDLQEALDIAAADKNTVVFNAPTQGTIGRLSPRTDNNGNIIPYEVPAEVTLLVPGESTYRCRKEFKDVVNADDFLTWPKNYVPSFYAKLILEDNTSITLKGGHLSIYATISHSQAYNGTPMVYGWLEMGKNCNISTTQSIKSNLFVMGYITGDITSSVTLHESSVAYESFQFTDFRGGSALAPFIGADMLNNKKGVFPVAQYYVQSIEVPMTIKYGASLQGYAAVYVNDEQYSASTDLLAESAGIVYMQKNVDVIKQYDTERDAQIYIVKGQGGESSKAKLGNIVLNLAGYEMNTEKFVLPIVNNMDLTFDGVEVTSSYKVALLAGSKVWIKENAVLDLQAPLYVYDKAENTVEVDENNATTEPGKGTKKGYYGSGNAQLLPIKYTPNKSHLVNGTSTNKRTTANLTSAELKVDGQLIINKDGLYTTKTGANIVSSTNLTTTPVIQFNATRSITEVYQAIQGTEPGLLGTTKATLDYPSIAVNSAWLKNSDGSYVETKDATVGSQYQYIVTGSGDDTRGVWSLPPAKVIPNTWHLPEEWKVTNPKNPVIRTITCQVENVTSANYTDAFVGSLNGTGFTFANGELANSISLEGNILSISVQYTPQNNTKDEHTAKLTLKNAQFQTIEYTYTTTLTATEEYIPEFSIDKSDITLQTLNNSVDLNNAFTITPTANNVATLRFEDGLVWSYRILNKDDDNENTSFVYSQGELSEGKIANNTVTFTSNTSGTQYARLEITATYTPKEGVTRSSEPQTINLIGTKLIENTLAFDMPTDIWVTDKNIPVAFSGRNNTGAIEVTLTANGEDGSPVVELREDAGTYYINALRAGSFTMQASQTDNSGVAGTTKTCTINVNKLTPNPTWNWGTVYGNQTYSTPFDPATVLDGKWTLVESLDPTNALAYDETTHTIQVMNVGETTSAQFTFTQEETEIYNKVPQSNEFPQSYQVIVNPDPRILTLVVDNKAKYDIVVADAHSEGVTCNEYGMITLPANGYVIVQFIGIPGDLTFQISEGAEYASISVAENTDKSNAETWQEITKSSLENKWSFTNANSSCVKLKNNSDDRIIISSLTISEHGTYNKNSYYGKAEAIVYPEGAGLVAAKGNYLNTSDDYAYVFTTLSEFDITAVANSSAVTEMTLLDPNLRFYLQAQSNAGYYFREWISVGSPMIVDELSWKGRNEKFELALSTTATNKSKAYSFDTYINLFCQQNQEICSAAKPESGEPNPEAVAYMNAGALALIPATNVGTWQANFALAEVESAKDAVWDEVTSPNASDVVEHAVVFKILGDDKNDFVATLEENKGFSFTDDKITLSAVNNTYTINASYAPQDVHGTHTAMLTLARVAVEGVSEESKKTITLTATENLTPDFTLANANFGNGTLGQESVIDILPADKNKVAQVFDPAKLAWTASLSENAPFEIVSIAEDGTCKVRYFRTESGAKSATLTITATYTDSKGTEIPFATTCTLTGSSTAEKAANTLALLQDIVLYVDDEPISPFSVNDANNTAPITFTLPEGCTSLVVEDGMIKPSGNFTTGTFTITVAQAENDYFQASGDLTTDVTVKKHMPEVTWNWTDLYFGQTYTVPVTTNSDGARTINPTSGNTNLVHYVSATETVTVDPLTEGEHEVVFSVTIAESNTFEARSQAYTATLYKDPRHVRVDVNSELTYRAVTIADRTGENVSFRNGGIHFADVAGSEYESRQWTMYFIGVPDQLFFTPSGNNAWEIRESSNGSNWRTTFASSKLAAGEQFAMSLSPNTTHVRIVYATNADAPSNGVLNSFYITALEGVKANVDGLYMPIAADVTNNPTTKQVILHYTSQEDLTISTSDPLFTVDENTLPKVEVDTYGEKTIVVTSEATNEKEGRIYVKNAAGDILLELPIYTFIFPQTLPIQLATDEPQRFYYVTTASNYAKWDMNTRVVTLQNAPANTTRSLTFAFDGAPTLLRFNHTAGDRGTWTIRERANNTDWNVADPATRVVSGNEIEQGLLNTTRYVQVAYTSPYSEKVEVSNLIIVGDASVTTDVNVLEFTETQPTSTLNVTAINLADFDVQIDNKNFTVTSFDKTALTGNGIVEVPVSITWAATTAVEYATLTIVNPNNDNAVLATVELVGKKQSISGPTHIGIYTGLAENITKLNGTFEGTERRPVDLTNAFDADTQTKALFDYLLIYGETSTMDGSTIITTPTNQRGSNAKTPCYIYQREGDTYKLLKVVDNVNDQDKAWSGAIPVPVSDIPTRVYITGFAPYASTGYTKEEEGVWCFRGQAGSKLDVYLEDSYIYSRYKTIDGHSFIDRDNGESFAEQYARGSGGVLVFECSSVGNKDNPFKVNIHTMDRNLLKSHYGCFLSSIVGRAFQVSSPIQVHLISTDITAATHLSFDDIWPTAITRTTTDGVVTAEEVSTKRTNGFISLQKQVNNAPSIDLGSPETVVNFNGGQVELQNAQNVSDNYKTTLAISYRGGKFAGYFLAHGVGSDEVTGTVNFNDGTTTVIPMTVDERYRQYYLMDEDEHGNELNITSCLRCPQNTYVYGGSHCMMRACNEPTSKGGAPWSHAGEGAVRLGMYKYPYASYTTDDAVTHAGGWTVIEGGNGLVSIPDAYVPNIKVGDQVARQYGVASVMPNDNGTPDVAEDDYLNFWVPAGYDDSVTPEVDLKVSYWKAAMTKIKAEYASYGGEVGGNIQIGDDTEVETELVYNLLYCVLDNDIRQVISAKEIIDGKEVYKYAAPVKHPAAAGYLEVRPSEVGTDPANYVENQNPYEVQNRVYYITPIASADNWMTFTAPFDVENIYVVETYDENVLATQGNKAEIKIKQAEHNADFAAFFGVALALGSDRDFDDIYANYIGWAKLQDVGKYTGQYNLRGKHELEYYDGTNWSTANYYLYENQGTWTINADGVFTTQWTLPNVSDDILMNKGETYSLLFPYCTGCWEYNKDGMVIPRTMWDYWSGKFVIFESTLRSEENPHVIDGVNTVQNYVATHNPAAGEAYVLGNTSLGDVKVLNEYLYEYNSATPMEETYEYTGDVETLVMPSNSFVLADIPINPVTNMPARGIKRTGEIIYGENGTSGHIPTVGGGNDLFITTIEEGINVAVAAPQHVRVLSSTGAVIYSGMIQTALDIPLPSLGMYVVSGEKEVQKVMY